MSEPSLPEPRLPLRIAVLASGRGSNLEALHKAAENGQLPIVIVAVLSDKAESGALSYARNNGIHCVCLQPRDFASREDFDLALMQAATEQRPGLIVCAGYMRIISPAGIAVAPCPMINIHPSLLPKYPGLNTHSRALANGDSEHGASVHLVNNILDGGKVLQQVTVPVLPNDTPESLAERVLNQEHKLLIETVRRITENPQFLQSP